MKARVNFNLPEKIIFQEEAIAIKTKTPRYICLGIKVLSTKVETLIKGNNIQNNLYIHAVIDVDLLFAILILLWAKNTRSEFYFSNLLKKSYPCQKFLITITLLHRRM